MRVASELEDNATYSASADDIAVQSYFFNIQLTNLSPRTVFRSISAFASNPDIRQGSRTILKKLLVQS
ncbi:hypothetical protein Tco_0901069 [Tanacetum coccineum]